MDLMGTSTLLIREAITFENDGYRAERVFRERERYNLTCFGP
jgi:hypothetical protein